MKKLISSFLASVGIMSSIPNINAIHFTSETKTSESQSKSFDWKSALLGGGLVGTVGIPVTTLISVLIGKNMGSKNVILTDCNDLDWSKLGTGNIQYDREYVEQILECAADLLYDDENEVDSDDYDENEGDYDVCDVSYETNFEIKKISIKCPDKLVGEFEQTIIIPKFEDFDGLLFITYSNNKIRTYLLHCGNNSECIVREMKYVNDITKYRVKSLEFFSNEVIKDLKEENSKVILCKGFRKK